MIEEKCSSDEETCKKRVENTHDCFHAFNPKVGKLTNPHVLPPE